MEELKTMRILEAGSNINDMMVLDNRRVILTCGTKPDIEVWRLDDLKLDSKIYTNGVGRMREMKYIESKDMLVVVFDLGEKSQLSMIDMKNKGMIFSVNEQWLFSITLDPFRNILFGVVNWNRIKCWRLDGDSFESYKEFEFDYPGHIIPCNKREIIFHQTDNKVYALNIEKENYGVAATSNKLKKVSSLILLKDVNKVIAHDYQSKLFEVYKY